MVCAVTASASIPRAPENRVGEIFAPSAKAHRFESLQLHQSQWDAQAFTLQIALDLTIDADGRVATQYGNWMYEGGLAGDVLRGTTSLLESASNYGVNNNNVTIASASAFASSITGSLSGMVSPSTYVDSVTNFGSNINTVYSERGIIDASSYALTSWNVGAIASGTLNVDLVTGAPVGDFFERATVVSGGVAATAGLTASVAAPVVSILSTPKPPPLPVGTFSEVPTNYITVSPTRGGVGPVQQGQAGVARAISEIEAGGGTILGREITLEVGLIRTRPDLFVRNADGSVSFVEVKNGAGAALTPNQTTGFPFIQSGGAIPRGSNAAAAGLEVGVPLPPTSVQVIRY